MAENRVLGVPSPRVEGEQKVGGKAVYAVDVLLPDMLWVKVLRSAIPHGRIKRIDVTKALSVPGVKVVMIGQDVAGARIGKRIIDMPILADGVVRYIGEKVAAVAAETEAAAERAVDQIEVEYEELPAVTNSLAALEPDARLLHPNVAEYKGLLHRIETPSNVFVHLTWNKGDVEEGFRQSDVVVENTFHVPAVHQAYIEPHSCLVQVKPDGGAEVWASTKSPFAMREQVGSALQVSPADLVIHPCYVGGDFGGKGDANEVALCYALSKKSGGRPVKFLVDYTEELIAGNPRHAATIKVKTGVKKNGVLIAHQMEYVFDSGAYGAYRPQGFLVGAHEASGPYRIPNTHIEEKYVYTNKFPCGYMRAPGHPQGSFASESQADIVAKKLGIDPAEYRCMNFMQDGDHFPVGESIAHVKAAETLKKALEESGYRVTKPKDVGVTHGRAERRMGFAEIARANGGPIIGEGHYVNMKEGPETSTVAQVAEVEVDRETGKVTVRRLTTVHNTGTILNPLTHQGQIDGAVMMGMGYGTIEELATDDGGKVMTVNLGDYKIPNIKDIPNLKTAIVQSKTGSGPYHSMSISETAIIPTAAAIANAVEDAVGVRIKALPITAEKVLAALKDR